jgi:multisubunit Na+/H+ antiporter MnhB subunit
MVKKHEAKKAKKQQPISPIVIIGAVSLIVIVIMATLFFNNRQTSQVDYSTYNNFEFTKLDNGWQTLVQKDDVLFDVPFYNHPVDITNVTYEQGITDDLLELFKTRSPVRTVWLAVPLDSSASSVLAAVNVARITGRFYGAATQSAFYGANATSEGNLTRPVINCEVANFRNIVVYFNESATDNSIMYVDNFCIEISGTDTDGLLASADYLGYKLLGIVK